MKRLYKILLPLSIAAVTSHASTKTVKHTIKKGETLYTIAHKNHTTIEEVRKANGLKKGDNLKIGRVLKVPKNTYNPKTKKKIVQTSKKRKKIVRKSTVSSKHVVKSGDSLYALALKNHTTVEKIRKANGIKKGQTLKLGQVLKVPAKATASKKKKRVHVASSRSSRQEKQLARTLKSVKFKKANTKKSSKFSIGDILFSGKGSKKSMKMIKLAKNKLGRRYVWGAVGQKNTFDCSGLTSYVCKKNGIKIPRRAIEQSKYGKYVSRKNLKPGDLIFFDTSKRRKGYVNHVGIYIGNNKFIHASSAKHKVVITSLSKPFYSQRFKGGRRVTS